MHPLSGSDLRTLGRALAESGGVGWRSLPQAALVVAAVLARLPFSLWERGEVRRRLDRAAEPAPPIFIVGHWRSGTTHLFNIMSRGGFAYVTPSPQPKKRRTAKRKSKKKAQPKKKRK